MSGSLRHVRILMGARRRALRNRLADAWSSHGILYLGAVVAAVGAAVALGHFAAPALLEPPADVAAGAAFGGPSEYVRGTAALEAAFWLALLASAVTSFRVMEILYRRSDLRAVEAYPIELPALYLDRLLATLAESAIASGALALFFVPLAWRGAPRVAGLSMLVVFAGMVASAALSFGLQVYAGGLNARASEGEASGRSAGVYGGPGQLFMFSPGIALATSAVAILLVRLGVGELLGAQGSLRAFWFAAGLLGVAVLASVAGAYRQFVANYPTMCARFREADAVSYTARLDYQTSDYATGFRLESLLPDSTRAPFRALALQYARGYSLVRYSYVIAWVLGALALTQWSRQAFPPWAVAMAPALLATTAASPWYRIVQPPLRPEFARSLPLVPADEIDAALGLAARELVVMVAPYALLVVWIDWGAPTPAAALLRGAGALAAPLAVNGAMALFWRARQPRPWSSFLAPLACAVGLLVVAVLSLVAAVAIASGLAALSFAVIAAGATRRPETEGRHAAE